MEASLFDIGHSLSLPSSPSLPISAFGSMSLTVASASFFSEGSLFEGGGVAVAGGIEDISDDNDEESGTVHGSSIIRHADPGMRMDEELEDRTENRLWSAPDSPRITVSSESIDLRVFDQSRWIVWKDIYRRRMLLDENWKNGRFTTREIAGHSEAIYCLQFDEDKIVSGSRDREFLSMHSFFLKLTSRVFMQILFDSGTTRQVNVDRFCMVTLAQFSAYSTTMTVF